MPRAPVLLTEAEGVAQGCDNGLVGFALSGVAMYKPYNSNCCDAVWDELVSMDYCVGHPNGHQYHYHFHAYGNYDKEWDLTFKNVLLVYTYSGLCLILIIPVKKCPMTCSLDEVGTIVGVSLDGFAIYTSMQYYSPSEGKVYIDESNCSDCTLMQLDSRHTDRCGGIEVNLCQ